MMYGALILVDNPFGNYGYDEEYVYENYIDQADFGQNMDVGTAYNAEAFGASGMIDANDASGAGCGGAADAGCGGGGCGGGGCGGGGCGGSGGCGG